MKIKIELTAVLMLAFAGAFAAFAQQQSLMQWHRSAIC
jgi:hypothetical protein